MEKKKKNNTDEHCAQASRMLHYLGDHILMLMSMNLRDYQHLKVEIQGTSGEGSKAVKSFRWVHSSAPCCGLARPFADQ